MHRNTKIATCCYCGSRAALTLTGDTRHELSCASCGAPLHDLKMLPARQTQKARVKPVPAFQPKPKKVAQHHPAPHSVRRKKPKKKKRHPARRALEEVFDLIEDIFD